MIKDRNGIRDYAVVAFGRVARLGFPTVSEYKNQICAEIRAKMATQDPQDIVIACESAIAHHAPVIADIDAVMRTFDTLRAQNADDIVKAVIAVYCAPGGDTWRQNVITYRIRAFAIKHYYGERTVHRMLKKAQMMFARYRGLAVEDEEGDIK